jgi:DNA modification methylase
VNSWRILHGDVRERLRDLPDGSVQTCVTSPPYWGLRDYGVSGQIGLEQTPDAFVAALVSVFAEVRRVLADDGTVWINLGDSYATGGHGGGGSFMAMRGGDGSEQAGAWTHRKDKTGWRSAPEGLKHKDLVGIPWRVAFALQADGWYLRSDIIWSKPNPMPESVTDRPTKAHEYIFLLSKSARYYYDAAAIAEAFADDRMGNPGLYRSSYAGAAATTLRNDGDRIGKGWNGDGATTGRNKRSVWHIATQPYPEAHFATFPEALIEPCILAGTSEKGCCQRCYRPWVRVVGRNDVDQAANEVIQHGGVPGLKPGTSHDRVRSLSGATYQYVRRATDEWQPSCGCNAGAPVPQTVLDPFNGSGTTGAVAIRHQRNYVGIELNKDYIELARKRIGAVAPLFAEELSA